MSTKCEAQINTVKVGFISLSIANEFTTLLISGTVDNKRIVRNLTMYLRRDSSTYIVHSIALADTVSVFRYEGKHSKETITYRLLFLPLKMKIIQHSLAYYHTLHK